MSSFRACKQLLIQDIKLAIRRPMHALNPILFGFLVALMFPLGLGPSPQTLAKLAPGLVWVIALLSCLLATDQLFREDFEDGSLAMWLLSPSSSYFLLLTRVFSHWLSTGFIIALMSPALAVMLSLPLEAVGALVGSILLGSISLIFIGAIGAALTVGLKNSSILLTLIILPLYVPVLIVAVACVNAAVQQLPTASYFALLAAFMMLAVTLAPLAIYGGLKINLDAA
jgi:heme exporter protein B